MKRDAFAIQSRREKIRALVRESGSVTIYEMSRLFDVSESTIRRDLEMIEGGGVERFHGGLRLNSRERHFEEKAALSADSKAAIALAAAALVRDGQTVFLNAGTTTLALFRELRDREVCVITNNVAVTLEPEPARAEVILVGGQYRYRTRSLVGGMAGRNCDQAYADICFLGANGVSLERGLTTSVHLEADVNRTMGERAGKVVCIADSTKIGVDAGFVSLPLEKVSTLITSGGADAALLERLRKRGIEIITAEEVGV